MELYGFKEKDLPRFARSILKNKQFSDKTKEDFIQKFLYIYLEDKDFAESVAEYVILFKNFKYYVKNVRIAATHVTVEDVKVCYEIEGPPICQYNQTNINPLSCNLKKNRLLNLKHL